MRISSGVVESYSISTSNHNRLSHWQYTLQVVSYSISTSNHNYPNIIPKSSELYLIPFLHQTTTPPRYIHSCDSCILFHFYIKPQQVFELEVKGFVVSYSISTSNHNRTARFNRQGSVVSYSISTSNHNVSVGDTTSILLYLIPFLHQTTTTLASLCISHQLYLIPFLHQTTTFANGITKLITLYLIPFLHQTTTITLTSVALILLYLIPFLHQTTT